MSPRASKLSPNLNSRSERPPDRCLLFLSRVDADIQQQMHRAVFEDFADCTVICIAHRLETLLHFDYVAVLDEGRITEWGNPHRLLEQSGGSAFARMYHQSIGT